MIVFATASAILIVIVACAGIICGQFSADELRKMGIQR
jgi:hypothetical protein